MRKQMKLTERRTLCFASPSVSSGILIATLRCDRSSNSQWHLTAQHTIAGFLLLPLTTSVSFPFFSSFPLRIYYADRHTLWICSASLVKQGSDWMMPGCRSSALLKSIFPAAALALASVLLSLDGFLFLSFLTRLTSWTSLAGCL